MRPTWTVYTRMLLVAAIACLASVARADEKKADDKKEAEKKPAASATGTWKWTMTSQDGQQRENTLKLKQDGEKLTGSLMGRNNQETEIADGKLKDGQVSFKVTRKFQEREVTSSYSGKLEGDTIKGKVERPGRDGGAARTSDWEAKRVKEEEKKSV